MRADRKPCNPRAYREGPPASDVPTTLPRMDALRNRLVATLAVAAIAVTFTACGNDDVDELREQAESSAEELQTEAETSLEELQTEAESSVEDLRKEGEDLRKEIEEGADTEELRKKVDEFEERARTEGEEIRKEAEELERELDEQVP